MDPVVSIIATHQARIRCIIRDITRDLPDTVLSKIHRFMNGAVIKLTIDGREKEASLDLVYNGDDKSSHKDKKYYVGEDISQQNDSMRITFPLEPKEEDEHQDAAISRRLLYGRLLFPDVSRGGTYIFFIIRHGEASHNTKKGFAKFMQSARGERDTKLTEAGERQAANVAVALFNKGDVFNEFRSAKYLFSSDLQRAMKTLAIVVGTAEGLASADNEPASGPNSPPLLRKINILPCAHELNYDPAGECDGVKLKQAVQGEENKSCSVWDGEGMSDSKCKYQIDWRSEIEYDDGRPLFAVTPGQDASTAIMGAAETREYSGTFGLDWRYYRDFYGNGLRGEAKAGRRKCRETNFLLRAINIINDSDQSGRVLRSWTNPMASPQSRKSYDEGSAYGQGGGKRRKRRSRKKRVKRTRRKKSGYRSRGRSRRIARRKHYKKWVKIQ